MEILTAQTSQFLFSAIPYILIIFFVLFFVLGGILDYHWRTYGIGFLRLPLFRIVYSGVGLFLLFLMTSAYLSL